MGTPKLIAMLSEIRDPTKLSRYSGKRFAIDGYNWFYDCLRYSIRNDEDYETGFIDRILKKAVNLESFGIEPYFVFDGQSIPTKDAIFAKRRQARQIAKSRVEEYTILQKKHSSLKLFAEQELAYMLLGDIDREKCKKLKSRIVEEQNKESEYKTLAREELAKSILITWDMKQKLFDEFDRRKIGYMIAPNEADAQLVYLERIGFCDGIIAQDSDLLTYGCKTLIRDITESGECVEFSRDQFHRVKKIKDFHLYSQDELQHAVILSGCDYSKGIMSLPKALSLVKQYGSYKDVLNLQNKERKHHTDVSFDYFKASLTFKYQKVFDPLLSKLVPLNEYPVDVHFDNNLLQYCCGKDNGGSNTGKDEDFSGVATAEKTNESRDSSVYKLNTDINIKLKVGDDKESTGACALIQSGLADLFSLLRINSKDFAKPIDSPD